MNKKLIFLLFLISSPLYSAILFDGVDDYVSIPYSANLTFSKNPFAVSFWVRVDDFTKGGIVGKQSSSFAYDGWRFECTGSRDIMLGIYGDGANETYTTTNHPISTSTWHNIIINADFGVGNTSYVYVDNVLQITALDVNHTVISESNPITFGKSYQSGTLFFKGAVDDVRVFDGNLSLDQIASLSLSRLRIGSTDKLRGYWTFDEGNPGTTSTTAVVLDRSSNTANGTPTNGPVWEGSTWISYP